LLGCLLILPGAANAQEPASSDADAAAEMARKLQDPLANIKALMTDNDINFDTGEDEDEVSYGFQLQPVYAIPFEKQGFNLVNRAVIPILGIAPGGQKSILGEPLPAQKLQPKAMSMETLGSLSVMFHSHARLKETESRTVKGRSGRLMPNETPVDQSPSSKRRLPLSSLANPFPKPVEAVSQREKL
jgi:hypothetical protein